MPAVETLNRLWRAHRPVKLGIRHPHSSRAVIEADGRSVIEVLPGDCVAQVSRPVPDPLLATAKRWNQEISKAFGSMAKDADPTIEDRP